LKGQVWYGKYRDDVVEQDGTVRRVQRRTPLGTKEECPTKRLAERKLEQILCRINAVEYRPGRVATLAEFAERRPQFPANLYTKIAENLFMVRLHDSILTILLLNVQVETNRVKIPSLRTPNLETCF
jgi:hypothetical protein